MPESLSTSTLSLILWPQQIFFAFMLTGKKKMEKKEGPGHLHIKRQL